MLSEELLSEAKEFFITYKSEIGKYAKEGKKSVQVSFQDLVSHSPELAEALLYSPEETIQILELALEENQLITNARVRLLDLPQTEVVAIRNLRAKHLNHLLCIEGLIRMATDVRPKIINARFECPNCGTVLSVLQLDEKFTEPNRCSCGRKGGFKLLSKDMVDAQKIGVEESPDSISGSSQPRRINVYLKEDLVEPVMEEKTTPGSKVKVIGILKEVPIPHKTGGIHTKFDLAIEANNIIPMEETYDELNITEEDEKQIQELATDPQLYIKLRESIAPSIFGYDEIKEALALQLFSGWRRQRSDGTYSRGDIHMLLVGDPGVAKSVMLKFISTVSPKGRYISGKAVTGAGLTATVIKDEFMRGWSLEAGTMVLAHKGLCAIDELEDMKEEDRSAMHEAMEQQTITISKANVHATLRAETSVLAAANPKFGRFDPYRSITEQINIDPALLTRFDLIFIMKDLPDRNKDEAIATHVLSERKSPNFSKKSIEPGLFKKYVAYSKQKVFPELTDQAVDEIKKFYVDLRNLPTVSENLIKPIPITARQLEALIRLSEAHARARLCKKVTKEDAKRAIELLKYCLMQVGFDEETKQIDIDKISTGVTASQKSKIIIVREAITRLESRLGKMIPTEELAKELEGKMDSDSVEEIVEKLAIAGDIFKPKRGFIQRM
jgi:replicative DNA helicase Mcm